MLEIEWMMSDELRVVENVEKWKKSYRIEFNWFKILLENGPSHVWNKIHK